MTDPHAELAAVLAAMPAVTARLLADHRDDGRGRCTGCTTPGTGTPRAEWPCTLYRLAREAQRIAEGQQ